jgi:acylphosphatase
LTTEFIELIVSGRVQGIGYREFARRAAIAQGVAGFVRNRSDGTVEARLVGKPSALEAVLAELRRGPMHARIRDVWVVARGESAPQSGFFVTATL